MRKCIIFFRLFTRPLTDDGPADENHETMAVEEISEKRIPRPRDWSAIFIAALRFLQLAFFAFAYCAILDFYKTSTSPGRHGPWQHGHRHSAQTMKWAYVQILLILLYHTVALTGPCVVRILKPTSRPFTSLATVFGDGIAAAALLNTIVLLDGPHERFCHGPPGRDFQHQNSYGFGRPGHTPPTHGLVCKSLDVVFGLGVFIILSYIASAMATVWRARRPEDTVFAKIQEAGDVEQGTVRRPIRAEQPSSETPGPRQHSPPPPYHPAVFDLAQEPADSDDIPPYPRGRTSVETTSSFGADAYLVSDGWRAPEQPPDYSSRPPSLRNMLS